MKKSFLVLLLLVVSGFAMIATSEQAFSYYKRNCNDYSATSIYEYVTKKIRNINDIVYIEIPKEEHINIQKLEDEINTKLVANRQGCLGFCNLYIIQRIEPLGFYVQIYGGIESVSMGEVIGIDGKRYLRIAPTGYAKPAIANTINSSEYSYIYKHYSTRSYYSRAKSNNLWSYIRVFFSKLRSIFN